MFIRLCERACPLIALYWNFFLRHKDKPANNPRIGMASQTLARMVVANKQAIRTQAMI